jgi:tetratricopeptide (TPR) repeat protein
VRADLLDVVIVWCDLHVRQAAVATKAQAHEDALQMIAEAQKLLGASCVLDEERCAHLLAIRGPAPEGRFERLAAATAWEHFALGRAYLRAGQASEALAEMDRALEVEPQALWPNFYKGKCAYQLKQFDEAAAAFSACVALAPGSAWCFYHRALAFLELGRLERAQADFNKALRIEPALAGAVLGRGIVHYRAKRYTQALVDLERAHAGGIEHSIVHYHRALSHLALQDRGAALASLRQTLFLEPSHRQAQKLLNQIEELPEPPR